MGSPRAAETFLAENASSMTLLILLHFRTLRHRHRKLPMVEDASRYFCERDANMTTNVEHYVFEQSGTGFIDLERM